MLHEIIKQVKNPFFWFSLFCMSLFVGGIIILISFGCVMSGFDVDSCGM